MANTIEFNKKCIPSPEYVVLRLKDRGDNLNMGGILIANSEYSNERLAHALVLDVGTRAREEYGLETGDWVMFDRLASAYQTSPIAVTKYVNVICKTNEDKSQFSPLKNMVFVEDEANTTQNVGGVLINNYKKKLNIGKIVAMNVDHEVPYETGDSVMISKGGDSLQLGDKHIFIYKHDMIVCKVEETEYEEEN